MKIIYFIIILLSITISVQAQSQLENGLVAHYPFNGNAIDESGHGNNGWVYDAQLVSDRFGNPASAYYFNGNSSYILVDDHPSLDITNKISITGWLYKYENIAWASMVTKGGEFGDENNYTLHNSIGSGVVFTSYNDTGTGGGICQSSISIPNNTWSFVAFTWDGITSKLFINGQFDTLISNQMTGVLQANNSSLYIGVDHPGETEYFYGLLDDIRIYNRDLTNEEMYYLYNEYPMHISENSNEFYSQIITYPNPARDFIIIDWIDMEKESSNISIYDISGRQVNYIQGIKSPNLSIDISQLSNGLYFLELENQTTHTIKFIKEN